jgi:hypothetical protein
VCITVGIELDAAVPQQDQGSTTGRYLRRAGNRQIAERLVVSVRNPRFDALLLAAVTTNVGIVMQRRKPEPDK